MKNFPKILITLLMALGISLMISASAQAIVLDTQTLTFDDVTTANEIFDMPDYSGFQWDNFGIIHSTVYPGTGDETGAVSKNYVLYNKDGSNTKITSTSGSFNFLGATLTAFACGEVLDMDENIIVEGWKNEGFIASALVTLSKTPNSVSFNFMDVDTIKLKSETGEELFFAMDNFVYSTPPTTPEPTSLLLGFLSLGGLFGFKRKNS